MSCEDIHEHICCFEFLINSLLNNIQYFTHTSIRAGKNMYFMFNCSLELFN